MIYIAIYLYCIGTLITYGLAHEVTMKRPDIPRGTVAAAAVCSILWPLVIPVALIGYYIGRGLETRKKETDWNAIKKNIRTNGKGAIN